MRLGRKNNRSSQHQNLADARGGDIQDPRWQAALAEFNALRDEIDGRTNTQGTLITLVVTAIGIVAGFVIKDNGDIRLLLVLPFLVSAAGIHSSEQDRAIALIGSYIRDELWPYLTKQRRETNTSQAPIPSWERVVKDYRDRHKHRKQHRYWSGLMLTGVPGALIFGCGSVVPLIILQSADGALPGLFDIDIYRAVWWLGVALTVIYALLARSAAGLGRPLSETLIGHGRPRQPTDSTGEPDPLA
jgi:hypothetical protein